MDEKETGYSAGFAAGAAYGIKMIMEALKKVSGNEQIPEATRVFLRGFVDNYQKDEPQIAEKIFEAIKRRAEGRNETCH